MDEEKVVAEEKVTPDKKKWLSKLMMIPIVAGIVIAGVTFGLPLVFATKKERPEPPEEPPSPPPESLQSELPFVDKVEE
jgi:flagellar basal body-associated protein FliL